MNGAALPQVGERLGPYEIIAPLGVGGMSEVHKARDTRLGREVAIKILDFEAARQPERLRLFEHEARAASAIEHPAIVGVHDVGQEGELPYVVLELVEGETLQRRLLRGRLPHRRAIEIAVQIGHGLAAAHARGILHNDLKPANIILTSDGRVKILDFGLAGLRGGIDPPPDAPDAEHGAAATQGLFGTPGYIAPERIYGSRPDARSDVFSLGAVLYEMLTGKPAFPGETSAEIIAATAERDPPATVPPLPPALESVLRRSLEKSPGQRFQSASDLAYALEAVSVATTQPLAFEGLGVRRWQELLRYVVVVTLLVGIGLAVGWMSWYRPLPAFHRMTFGFGAVASARFAADGRTVFYSAAWEGQNRLRLYSTRTDARGANDLALEGDLVAASHSGELAVFPNRPYPAFYDSILSPGEMLARVPLGGGAPRGVLPDVVGADWSPDVFADGMRLAVVRDHGGIRSLEFPIGRVLYQTAYGLRSPRFSPRGDRIAFFEGGIAGDQVSVLDLRSGRRQVLTNDLTWCSPNLAWSRGGDEIWFSAEKVADHPRYGSWRPAIRAVSLAGRERTVLRLPDYISLQDLAPDGRALLTVGTLRAEVQGQPAGEHAERNLSWHEGSSLLELSRDGRNLLFYEQAELATYLRPTNGGPALRLCDNRAQGLSPDGQWVLRIGTDFYTGQFLLVPTVAGEPRYVRTPKIAPWGIHWFSDGQRFLLTGNEENRPLRAWVIDVRGAPPRAITPEGIGCWLVSPDGRTAACARPEAEGYLYPVEGGEPRPFPGFRIGDHMRQWSDDGRFVYVSERYARPGRIFRLDLQTGERTLWRELNPPNPTGVVGTIDPGITPDGSGWAYSVLRHVNDLYVVEGLR